MKKRPQFRGRDSKEAEGRKLVAEERRPAERATRVDESRTIVEEDQTHCAASFLNVVKKHLPSQCCCVSSVGLDAVYSVGDSGTCVMDTPQSADE